MTSVSKPSDCPPLPEHDRVARRLRVESVASVQRGVCRMRKGDAESTFRDVSRPACKIVAREVGAQFSWDTDGEEY